MHQRWSGGDQKEDHDEDGEDDEDEGDLDEDNVNENVEEPFFVIVSQFKSRKNRMVKRRIRMMRKGRFLSDFHDVVKAEQQRIIQTVHYVCTNPLHPHSPPLTLTAPPAFLPMQTPPCAFLCGQQAVSHHDNRFSCPSQYIRKHDQHCQ